MDIHMIDLLIRVIVADNHPVSIRGIKNILRTAPSIRVVATCKTAAQLVDTLSKTRCDVVVCDMLAPCHDTPGGIELFGHITAKFPTVKIVALTLGGGSVQLHKLAALRVSSILTKSDPIEHVVPAIYSSVLCSGGSYRSPRVAETIQNADSYSRKLTPRESEVVRLFASGLPVKDIAVRLGRSIKTVSSQKRSAMKKMGAASDAELIRAALDGVGGDSSRVL
ncbi:hypothetical protein WT37_19400 [Burkholderia territorii]|nr:hypothetical protein WT37_19400 [Burkholderia territorii]